MEGKAATSSGQTAGINKHQYQKEASVASTYPPNTDKILVSGSKYAYIRNDPYKTVGRLIEPFKAKVPISQSLSDNNAGVCYSSCQLREGGGGVKNLAFSQKMVFLGKNSAFLPHLGKIVSLKCIKI